MDLRARNPDEGVKYMLIKWEMFDILYVRYCRLIKKTKLNKKAFTERCNPHHITLLPICIKLGQELNGQLHLRRLQRTL